MYHAKYQNSNVPFIPLHVSGRQLCWLFHFLSITMPQWLLSSFGAKQLSFIKKQVLCFIPRTWSTHHWDFLIITITVFWLIWQCPLPDDTIRIWSAALVVSMCLFLIAPTVHARDKFVNFYWIWVIFFDSFICLILFEFIAFNLIELCHFVDLIYLNFPVCISVHVFLCFHVHLHLNLW